MHIVASKISRAKNALDYDSPRCDIRVRVHAIPNKIGRVKNAPD